MFYPRSNSCFIGYFFIILMGIQLLTKFFTFQFFLQCKIQKCCRSDAFFNASHKKVFGKSILRCPRNIFFSSFFKNEKKNRKKSSKFALVVYFIFLTIAPKLRRFWKGPPTLLRRSCRKKEWNTDRKRKKEEKRKEKKREEKKEKGRWTWEWVLSPPQAKKLPILKSAFLAVFTHFWDAWIAKSDSARRDLSVDKFSEVFAQWISRSGHAYFWSNFLIFWFWKNYFKKLILVHRKIGASN